MTNEKGCVEYSLRARATRYT